ncbi:MAG TPA: class I SAM-dependent methyltransferase [Longimicrobium sp.]|nr:class I SAM-dependent methyltransferase [Longimicrobium sp.]
MAMEQAFRGVVSKIRRRYGDMAAQGAAVPFAVRANGSAEAFGDGEPAFTFVVREPRALDALATLDGLVVGEAYLAGAFDVEGDIERVLEMRDLFSDRHPLLYAWRFVQPRLFGQVKSDEKWIPAHYDTESDFFLRFLDTRHRAYSQGIYARDDEPLEDAITRKLDFARDSAGIRPGDRVLDVGGGWGAFTEYGGKQDVRVTSLTISPESERFLNGMIERERLPCEVRREHLFAHQPAEKYDAIVVLGVTEHLPDYPGTLKKYRSLLKPGGKVYLDASACRRKYDLTAFVERHIYPGNGSPMCLHDYLGAVAASPFRLEGVFDDRHSYALTAREWARRLDAHRDDVERRWGKALYRKFQLFLWGTADGMARDTLQAYRVVLGLPKAAA